MLSYHNDENIKKLIVFEMRKHQEQDQFVKNTYGREEGGKFNGCAVGCAIDSINIALGKRYRNSDHKVFEEELGIPEWLAHLQDSFFEVLPIGENSQFAVDFLESIPVGVNLGPVKYNFCEFLMRECLERVLELPYLSYSIREQVLSAIRGVMSMYNKAIKTRVLYYEEDSSEDVLADAAYSAAMAARAAADAACSSERDARAAADAADAACSAARAARSSEMAAACSARSAARGESDAYKRYSMELIRLLKEAK